MAFRHSPNAPFPNTLRSTMHSGCLPATIRCCAWPSLTKCLKDCVQPRETAKEHRTRKQKMHDTCPASNALAAAGSFAREKEPPLKLDCKAPSGTLCMMTHRFAPDTRGSCGHYQHRASVFDDTEPELAAKELTLVGSQNLLFLDLLGLPLPSELQLLLVYVRVRCLVDECKKVKLHPHMRTRQ
eukprot:1234766-Rhodomonas_salina.1